MKFLVVFLFVALLSCSKASDPSDAEQVEQKFAEDKEKVESKFLEMVKWLDSKFDETVTNIRQASSNFPQCSLDAIEKQIQAKNEILAEMKKRRDAMQEELQRERDETLKSIEEEKEKSESLSSWLWGLFTKALGMIRQAFWDAADFIVQKASEFLEFRKKYSQKSDEIYDEFRKCLDKAEAEAA